MRFTLSTLFVLSLGLIGASALVVERATEAPQDIIQCLSRCGGDALGCYLSPGTCANGVQDCVNTCIAQIGRK
ncbi:hypothetical protein BDN72DRAFT_903804 [Pluteus cervinus]|uniref:Uncharacterized protein n=1 Tax=Pluteus cervinus TaxID=181527 RepID=A0ACD3A858_9AGAR|nr:hypothetical protein BDN72DRAFT_903804 [Pluteus cervinus]